MCKVQAHTSDEHGMCWNIHETFKVEYNVLKESYVSGGRVDGWHVPLTDNMIK